jgi:cytochrome P450 family 9
MSNAKLFLKIIGLQVIPKVMKFFNISFFDKSVLSFFQKATLETMKVREEEGIIRQDMVNLLMQAKKGSISHNIIEEKLTEGFAAVEESEIGKSKVKRSWRDNELIAQCLIFFFAGFDSVSLIEVIVAPNFNGIINRSQQR